jgi:hypothetical protein
MISSRWRLRTKREATIGSPVFSISAPIPPVPQSKTVLAVPVRGSGAAQTCGAFLVPFLYSLNTSSILRLARRHAYPLLFAGFLLGILVPACLWDNSDWDGVYVTAGARLLAGKNLFQDGFFYPPAFALVAAPFSLLPPVAERLAWIAMNAMAMGVMLSFAWKLSGGLSLKDAFALPKREHLIFSFGLATGIYYMLDAWTNAQTDMIVAALAFTGCWCLSRKRELAGGALIGLAAGLKCTPLLFVPYLLWRGRLRAAAVLLTVAVGINLLPELVNAERTGQPQLVSWVEGQLAPFGKGETDPGRWHCAETCNHSLAGLGMRWLTLEPDYRPGSVPKVMRADRVNPLALKAAVYSTCLVLVLAALWSCRRIPNEKEAISPHWQSLEFSQVFILMLLLSPVSSKPHFCALILPGFCLARIAVKRKNGWIAAVLLLAILSGLLSNKDLVGGPVYRRVLWHGSVVWNAVFLFAGCLYVRRVWPDWTRHDRVHFPFGGISRRVWKTRSHSAGVPLIVAE